MDLTYVVGGFIIRRIGAIPDHDLGSDRRYTVKNDEQVALSTHEHCFNTLQRHDSQVQVDTCCHSKGSQTRSRQQK